MVGTGWSMARHSPASSGSREDPYAPDQLLSLSARNRLSGVVTRVQRDKLTAIIEVRAGRFRVVSLLTREAADDLN